MCKISNREPSDLAATRRQLAGRRGRGELISFAKPYLAPSFEDRMGIANCINMNALFRTILGGISEDLRNGIGRDGGHALLYC